MKAAADAAQMLRDSNPVAEDAFAGAAGDSLGRATFERIIDPSAEPAQASGRPPRRWRQPVWLAAVAAGVAVIAVAAAVLPGALLNGADGPVAYAANVVKGVNSALTHADSGTFAQMTVTTSVAPIIADNPGAHGKATTTTAEEWSHGDRWRSVTNSAAGHPVYGAGFGPSGYTLVSYPRRTWARLAGVGRPAGSLSGPTGCGQVSAAGPVLFQPTLPGTGLAAKSLLTVARTLHAAVACGTLEVSARQRFEGVEAYKLTSGRNSIIAETIWVSAGTYLPMRVVIRSRPGRSLVINSDVVLRQTADFTWLPPTAQNLAKLTVPIPAGFRRIPYGQAVSPIAQQMPRGLPLGASGLGYPGHHPGNLLPSRRPQKPS